MFRNRRSYDITASRNQPSYEIPVVYRSLSANTHNALEKFQTKQEINKSRKSSITSVNVAIEKLETAIVDGFVETTKDTYLDTSILNSKLENEITSANYENKVNSLDKKTNLIVKKKSTTKLTRQDIAITDHLLPLDEFLNKHRSNLQTGLKNTEVEERRALFGTNMLEKKKNKYLLRKFCKELISGFNIMLWIAAILSVLCWEPFGGDKPDINNLVLGSILFTAIIIQSIFSFFQQCKADQLMASFESLMPHKTTVFREGKYESINTWELVNGDIIRLNAGDKIPADTRIIECHQATVEKSALTGESEPIKLTTNATDLNPYETKNLALFGSSFLEGTATGIVFQTGERTIMGRIADLAVNTKNEMTTMQREMNYFALMIGSMAIVTALLTFTIWLSVIKQKYPAFLTFADIVVVCLGITVSFMPAGIQVSVTMTLTLIAKKMKKINVLVKKLAIIETLGSTTVIASDKTGTITMNKMSLNNLSILNFDDVNCLPTTKKATINEYFSYLLKLASLCNKATIGENKEKKSEEIIGSPTESGILKGCCEFIDVKNIRKENPIIFEIPFNSRYKYSATIHKLNSMSVLIPNESMDIKNLASNKSELYIIKGAPEVVMGLCKYGINGDTIEAFESIKQSYLEKARSLAAKGQRVLGYGFTFLDYNKINIKKLEDEDVNYLPDDLCFAGLLSLIDPPREGVADSVAKCHEGGIKVMMVTGDHELTAVSIARMVNIIQSDKVKTFDEVKLLCDAYPSESHKSEKNFYKKFEKLLFLKKISSKLLPQKAQLVAKKYSVEGSVVINGKDISELSVEYWDYVLSHNEIVFARTTPENKLAIVQQLQRRGEIVTVTGDGVNDAPALRKADIGIAMGITGTEISKEAAKIVIMDDNFSTIVNGIEQGRLLFDNLKKVIAYLLPAGSFSEIVPVIAYVFFGFPLPLTILQMVVICICTDMLGSLGMIFEYAEADIMKRKPRNAAFDHLISFPSILKIYFQTGLLELTIAFFMYFYTMSTYHVDLKELIFAFDKWNMNGTYAGVDLATRNEALKYSQTGFFVALVMSQLINLLTVRTRFQSFFKQRFRPILIVFMLGEVVIVVLVCYIKPLQPYFGSTNAYWYHFVFPLLMGLSVFIVDEIKKLLIRKYPNSFISHFIW